MKNTKIAIIGSGPAGYTAAIYTARAQLKPVIFTGLESGGQLMYTTELENFPGFPEGVMGTKFMMSLREQAKRFAAEIIDGQVTAVDFSQRPFKLWTNLPGETTVDQFKKMKLEEASLLRQKIKQTEPAYLAESVIISTGATAITLGVPGENKFLGRGLSVCAVCDAAFFRDKNVFVIGGGDSAMEDALVLTKFANQVTIIHRRDNFKASKIMQERVLSHPKIKVLWNSSLKEVAGEQMVNQIKIETEGKEQKLVAEGVFLAIGHRPVTSLFEDQLELTTKGYLVTRKSHTEAGLKQAQAALNQDGLVDFPTMTSVEGVFAAGDVVDNRYQQAITAAGMGAAAGLDAERWLDEQDS